MNTETMNRLERLAGYLAANPDNVNLLADLADGHLRAGNRDLARGYLDRILALHPGDVLARYRLAVLERNGGDAAEAARQLRELVAEGVAEPAVHMELSRALAQQNDWAGAVAALQTIQPAALPPEDGDAVWLLRIRGHHRLGQLDQGREEGYQWRLARGRLPTIGLAALATLELDAERLDQVAELLKQCSREECEASSELQCAAGFLALGEGELPSATERFAQAVKLRPDEGRNHLGLGLTAATQGELPTAMAALDEATRLMPRHLGSWHALAWMQLLTDDLDGAAATFRQAEQQDHSFGETHGGLALVAALRGEQEEARERIRIATRLEPKSMNAAIARLVLQRGVKSLRDGDLLQQGLGQFSQLALKGNSGMQAMLAKVFAGAGKRG